MEKLLFCVEKEMFFVEDRGLALLGLINSDFDHLSIPEIKELVLVSKKVTLKRPSLKDIVLDSIDVDGMDRSCFSPSKKIISILTKKGSLFEEDVVKGSQVYLEL
ncbi:MAG: hypothetical protein ABSA84_07585 [Gammaproteobacteria bacterium]|jgi:hypothetical protein